MIKYKKKQERQIVKIEFARGNKSTDAPSNFLLHINNCGYYSEITERVEVRRKKGRQDHHIVFVASGDIESNRGRAVSGDVLYYRPSEEQSYRYLPAERSLYLWLHFSGTLADKLIRRDSGIISCQNKASEIRELAQGCFKAISRGGAEYEKHALGLLVALAGLIDAGEAGVKPFSRALGMMNDFSSHYKLSDLASASGVGTAHFTRLFKRYFGKTPIEYTNQIRIEQAKSMLRENDMKIKAIAETVGYSDALYFSRVFKKESGYSPSEYRKMEREMQIDNED